MSNSLPVFFPSPILLTGVKQTKTEASISGVRLNRGSCFTPVWKYHVLNDRPIGKAAVIISRESTLVTLTSEATVKSVRNLVMRRLGVAWR